MAANGGRAYVFVRWSGSPLQPSRLGEVAWAFEFNDRLGRFNCFYFGATEYRSDGRAHWQERCVTLPELTKAMLSQGSDGRGYDEVKVFEVEQAKSESALQFVAQRAVLPKEVAARLDSIEETREILARYGVRGLANSRGFSAPFLWYNMLSGKSVPVRKLTVHLFQMRQAGEEKTSFKASDLEEQIRRIAAEQGEELALLDCYVVRVASRFVIGLRIAVDKRLSVAAGREIGSRLEAAIRQMPANIGNVFAQAEPRGEDEHGTRPAAVKFTGDEID